MRISGLNREKATKLHFNVWLVMHGLAAMLATNKIEISDDEIKDTILNNFKGCLNILRQED